MVTVVLVLLLVIGMGLMLYPTVSDWLYSMKSDETISQYQSAVESLDDQTRQDLWNRANAYNQTLVSNPYRFYPDDQEKADYLSQLAIDGTSAIATIRVPGQDIYLPVFHGSSSEALSSGAGHLEGSSLPIGGPSTHSVISAHTGLPEAELFDNISNLEIGDLFVVSCLGEDHVYEVEQILTVLPEEMDALNIVEGEDLCTLLTCTPYGINTHRLLVIGKRAPEGTTVPEYNPSGNQMIIIAATAAVVVVILVIWLIYRKRKKYE